MSWIAEHTDLLIGVLAGVAASLLVNLITGITSRVWKWWDARRAVKDELHHLGLLFENTDSPKQLSALLVEAKAFMLLNDVLLERPEIKTFFDGWLKDEVLGTTGAHPRLHRMGSDTALKELKADAARAFLKQR